MVTVFIVVLPSEVESAPVVVILYHAILQNGQHIVLYMPRLLIMVYPHPAGVVNDSVRDDTGMCTPDNLCFAATPHFRDPGHSIGAAIGLVRVDKITHNLVCLR
jgi:hypothetical protein